MSSIEHLWALYPIVWRLRLPTLTLYNFTSVSKASISSSSQDDVFRFIVRKFAFNIRSDRLIPAWKEGLYDERPSTPSSYYPSQWLAEGRDLASRASSRASFSVRRSRSRRPTIGTPSDFRRVDVSEKRREDFRPLELSIYLPGNRLSPLPMFSEALKDGPAGLEYPPNALIRARSDSLLYRPSTSFAIPRKPVPSITGLFTTDESRLSIDAQSARPSIGTHSRSQSLRLGSSKLDTGSSEDFLAALDARLPQSPSPLRTRSSTEPGFTLHRRASEQNLRLRTHLEERQEIERRLKDIDTILEEKPPVPQETEKRLQPITACTALIKNHQHAKNGLGSTVPSRPKYAQSTTMPDIRSALERPLPATPLTFNQPNPTKQPAPPPPPPKSANLVSQASDVYQRPSLHAHPYPQQRTSTRSRVSQWLFPSTPDQSNTAARAMTPLGEPFYQCSASFVRTHAATDSSVSSMSNPLDDTIAPTATTTSSPERHGIALPTYQACQPYQEFETNVDKPSSPVSVGLAF
ncbi:MAG: hypothetical protein M1830_009032 [Pleopsidium flavum]|nr:MAG: hypothetical protein M1830_009032 [Pleopsidium flavum]